MAISTALNDQVEAQITSDGIGGAIITWEDNPSGNADIYAQRIDSTGSVQWTANGVAVSTAADFQLQPQIASDELGGAIITWGDARSGTNWDCYAQRIDSSGSVQWTANGVAISTAANNQTGPQMSPDGLGGAIIAWEDNRGGNFDIYAQRIDSSGAVQWTANGVAISTAANTQGFLQIAPDGLGGGIITWRDFRTGTTFDIYAQRIDFLGATRWTPDGLAVTTAANDQNDPHIVSDGLGGAIIAWGDSRSGNDDIYAQRIDFLGVERWTPGGLAIATTAGNQVIPQIASDGWGGAIITWEDFRGGMDWDIYAQGFSGSGR